MSRSRPSRDRSPIKPPHRLARQNQNESNPLQHLHRRIRQPEPPLQQTARGAEAAEQNCDRDARDGLVPRDEGHQDPRIAVSAISDALALACTAATSTAPASPAQPPPSYRARRQAAPGGSPANQRAAPCADCHRRRAAKSRGRCRRATGRVRGRRRRREPVPSARPSRRSRRSASHPRATASTACPASPDRATGLDDLLEQRDRVIRQQQVYREGESIGALPGRLVRGPQVAVHLD